MKTKERLTLRGVCFALLLTAMALRLAAMLHGSGGQGLALLNDYDRRIKALLTEIFGAENDFDKVLEGVNLAGCGANGKRVVQNLLDALTPILQEGAARHLKNTAAAARAEADAARAARGEV